MLTTIEKVMRLQRVDLFEAVPSELLADLAAVVDEMEHAAGVVVFAQGDPADALYVVQEGMVRVHRGGDLVAEVGPDDTFGTWAILEEGPRLFTATVVADARLLRIHRQDMTEFVSDHHHVAMAVLAALAGRLRQIVLESSERERPEDRPLP